MFDQIFALHQALGLPPLNQMSGGWSQALPGGWHMVVNGKDSPIEAKIDGFMTIEVQPFTASFWFNGWYAGDVRPYVDASGQVAEQGIIAAGAAANEQTLLLAFDQAIAEAQP